MNPAMQGNLAAIFAYVSWGFFPVYFKQIVSIDPVDIIAWRVLLCFVFLVLVLLLWLRPKKLWQQVTAVKQWSLLLGSALMLSVNWLVFVYAIKTDQILQSSLGYFLVPIVSVALGMLAFGERPNLLKRIAVVIAALGMLLTFIVAGQVPWIALVLGVTFGIYGMFRKQANYDSAVGLMMETAVLLPIGIAYVLFFSAPISSASNHALSWMMLLGAVTSAPLLTMIFAARRIELSALGFYQYITPTLHLVLAIVIYHETLDQVRIMALVTTLVAVSFWLLGSLPSIRARLSKAG